MPSEPSFEVGVHRGDPGELQDLFSVLVDPQHPGCAFRSAAWLSPWWKMNSIGRRAHVLTVKRGRNPIAVLPLYEENRRLKLMGDGIVGSDHLGVITRDPSAVRLLAFHLASYNADELELDGIDEGDPLLRALDAAFGARVEIEPRYRCPYVRLSGSFSAYLDKLPDGLAHQWRRRKKWLENRPGYRLDILRSPAEISAGLDALLDLHRQRWAIEGGSDGITPELEPFHRDAARRLAAIGWAVVFVLHAEGAPRAALYGFRHGDRFAFYQSGHEPAWRPRSVGTVLLGHTIRWAFDEGLREYDFLRGDEAYKLKWATDERRTVRVRAVGHGLRPWLRDRARRGIHELREAVKQALPDEALMWARRARRGWR